MERPHIIIIAGPNGAGKSTTAPSLLQGTLGVEEFVNADEIKIAHEQAVCRPVSEIEAARIMLKRMNALAKKRSNFAFETTLSSVHRIKELNEEGYVCHLIFLWLPSPEFAITRVRERVLTGGHDVAEGVIRRRYDAGIKKFFEISQELTETWYFYDNSTGPLPALIASKTKEQGVRIENEKLWRKIEEEYSTHGKSIKGKK